MEVFAQIIMRLLAEAPDKKTNSIDTNCLKAHQLPSSRRAKKRGDDVLWSHQCAV